MKGLEVMRLSPIKTSVFQLGDDLGSFILTHAQAHLKEGMILAITSKIVSLAENRIVPLDEVQKSDLVKRESDHYFGEIGYGCHLTIKHGLFIPSAGIDESNAAGAYYILYPQNPFASAKRIYDLIRKELHLTQFGVILTDSHTQPLRRGVIGTCLSYWGFRGVKNMVGQKDLFGRELKMTQVNYADALAVSAVLMMGECAEQTPLAWLEAPVEFTEKTNPSELMIPIEEDLYFPFFKGLIKT